MSWYSHAMEFGINFITDQPTFSESPQPYDATVAITSTPKAPAPEN